MMPDQALIRKVLAVVDAPDAPGATHLLLAAKELATRHGATVSVFACIEPPSDLDRLSRATGLSASDMLNKMVRDKRDALVELGQQTGLEGIDSTSVVVGKPFLEISRHVATQGVDVVVKAAERLTGAGRFLFASTDQHLVRKCPCSIWLRLPEMRAPPKTILAAVDVDECDAREPETLAALNRQIIETAIAIACGPDAVIYVLHAWETAGEGLVGLFSSSPDGQIAAQRYVNDVLDARSASLDHLIAPFVARSSEMSGPRILSRLGKGEVRSVISEHAEALGADILVMGTVARTGISGVLIGNTAEDILNTVGCSVMTVKPQGFVSPLDLGG